MLSRFEEVGLINDGAFADAWVESRHHGRGLARRALARELRTKGVDATLIDAAQRRPTAGRVPGEQHAADPPAAGEAVVDRVDAGVEEFVRRGRTVGRPSGEVRGPGSPSSSG
ncbi:Regulatory protein RecX [Streptomyces violaceorubidus]